MIIHRGHLDCLGGQLLAAARSERDRIHVRLLHRGRRRGRLYVCTKLRGQQRGCERVIAILVSLNKFRARKTPTPFLFDMPPYCYWTVTYPVRALYLLQSAVACHHLPVPQFSGPSLRLHSLLPPTALGRRMTMAGAVSLGIPRC